MLMASAYRVPHNTTHQIAADLDDLESQIQHMVTNFPRATLMIGGDLNCCLLRTRNSTSVNPLQRLCDTYGLTVTNKTHATYRPSGSLLDVIITSRPDLIRRAGVTRCHYGGPHDFTRVLMDRDGTATAQRQSSVYRRAISKIDSESFNHRLAETDWTPVYYSMTTEGKWNSFNHTLISHLDAVAPLKSVRQRQPTGQPVSAETRQLLQRRRAALAGNDRDEYKRANRLRRAAVRNESRARFATAISRGDQGGLWQVLRPVIGRKQQQCEVPRITPDALNNYYVSIGPSTAATVPVPTTLVPTRLTRVSTCSFEVRPIDIDTLCVTLASMKPSNSVGVDGISVSLLQKLFAGVGYTMLDIVNSSLATGSVPQNWKHALITPIPKGRVSAEPSDTRPISILPAIMKLVERVVQRQLICYLEDNHLLSDAQHGYRKYHSTETALHAITDQALHAMDNGEICILVLLDLSKCFDVVPHQKLLEKLAHYGINTKWFRSYLADHSQQVQVRCADGSVKLSKTKNNVIGVYQGGALSCILYMLFANDLSLYVPENVTIVQYADDTQLMVTGRKTDIKHLVARMEKALDSVHQWFCHNKMKLNAKKTQMLVLGTQAMLRGLPPVQLKFCENVIPDSKVIKNLGVLLDSHLTFEAHIDHMSRKCTGILMALNQARHVIPRSALKDITEALALSTIRYCMSVYGSCGETQLHRVQKLINFSARVVTGKRRYDHISGSIAQLGWLTAKQLVVYHTVSVIERAIMSGRPECLLQTIGQRASQRHDHDTRRADSLTLPPIRTESGRRRLCYRGVSLINGSG